MSSANDQALKIFLYVVKTLKDVNGRGNFNKALQYGAKLAAVELAAADPKSQTAKDMNAASALISNGRKLGFLGMWMDMVDATRSVDWTKPRDALRGLSNLSTAVYYLADNAAFLTKLKFASVDETAATKLAMMTFWFGQLFALVGEVMDFQANLAEEKAVRADAGGDKSKLDKDKLRKILTDRFWLVNSFVVRIGNLTYASNGWDLPAQFIGKFSDRTCAVAGLVAALAALYKNADTANPAVKKQ